jgi:hypothetical protein
MINPQDLITRRNAKIASGVSPADALRVASKELFAEMQEQQKANQAARIVAAADARAAKVSERQQAAAAKLDSLRTLAAKATKVDTIPTPSPRVIG